MRPYDPTPAPPPPPGEREPTTRRPPTLTAAFVLWLVVAAALLGEVVLAEASYSSVNTSQPLLLGVLTLVAALRVRLGRRWARVALTVVGAFMILPAVHLNGFAAGAPGWVLAVVAMIALIGVGGIVLLYLPASNAYVRAATARRR
jgi:peptidoglycan/LPS O-acetylase OafA/YrhL